MRTLILGAGGIGGYFGGRLAQSGAAVTFLVREARAASLRSAGLVIESPAGNATMDIATATKDEIAGAFDLVLVSCKAYDLADAIEAIRPAVGADTLVLPLLNGLAHLDALDAAFGAERVLGGLAHISVALAPSGTVRHLNMLQTLTFGAREPSQEAGCARLLGVFATAPFEARQSSCVVQEMWEKFAFITAAASITCLMRAPIGAIMATTDGARITVDLLAECEAVAAGAGFPVREKAHEWAAALLTAKGSTFTASMLRDLEDGSRVEADHLQGDMIRRARQLGITASGLQTAYCHLQSYANRRGAGSA